MDERIAAYRLRQKLLRDPFRPVYHFASPGQMCMPGDPNGAFYALGRYHLMYLYYEESSDSFRWGHISSADLLHWRWHPDALTDDCGDKGCFSGGAFLDDDGTAYLTFWKFPSKDFKTDNGGIDIAYSKPPYDVWTRMRPVAIEGSREVWGTMDITADGETLHLGCADPSNIWKMNGHYYMQLGNKCVLDAWGREADAPPMYKGDWTELMRSDDLRYWEFVRRFYENPHLDADYPDETEDDMCPSFLPLHGKDGKPTGKWLQLFISHNKGAQYYIGRLDGEQFFPEQHGRFSWVDNTCFAPEALVDNAGRQLAWFWLLDDPDMVMETYGWQGVYTFPRELWLEDSVLHMAPARELDFICSAPRLYPVGSIEADTALAVENPDTFRLKVTVRRGSGERAGFVLARREDGTAFCRVYVDFARSALCMETVPGRSRLEEAPITVNGDAVSLEILVDHAVIEVFADCRQAISRRFFGENAPHCLIAMGGGNYSDVETMTVSPTNPF